MMEYWWRWREGKNVEEKDGGEEKIKEERQEVEEHEERWRESEEAEERGGRA